MKQNSSVLVVEDEPGIAELLRFTLQADGFAVEVVTCAHDAQQALARALPSVVLLDWMLPDEPGISLLNNWRASPRTATLPVIMLTAKGLDEDKVKGLNSGADDYVTKPFSPRELVARINAVLRRQRSVDSTNVQSVGVISVDEERHLVMVSGAPIELGPAEFKLLRFLVSYPERVFSRGQLLDKVWGDNAFFEERTVDVHIMRLRKSLGVAADCIKTIRSVGYMLKAGKTE
ncbi:MAG TPA: winged helix-turn-helix domain-containing protein [Burkholderiaceae bacterium]|jgi:two-component system phosphate regulon response regulator PhoB|nr:winged helix-turn-helix domain-containing protein [Burkholderiaceae bacterium]